MASPQQTFPSQTLHVAHSTTNSFEEDRVARGPGLDTTRVSRPEMPPAQPGGAEIELEQAMHHAHSDGHQLHGGLGLSRDALLARFNLIIENHLSQESSFEQRLAFFERLHTADLYLATACAMGSHAAWDRFALLYSKRIGDFSRSVARSADAATELAATCLGHLYWPDAEGISRITSYWGRASLANWLTVVIRNLAGKQRLAHRWSFESLESCREIGDDRSNPESDLVTREQSALICEAVHHAAGSLSDHERLVLTLHHCRNLRPSQIARLCGVQRSSITRQIQRTHKKLHRQIVAFLSDKQDVSVAGVESCISEMLNNPYRYVVMFFEADH